MKLFNSLTRKKEEFKTITPNVVKMYACGPTVYDFFHIGNARPFIVFDTLRRYFEYCGYKVEFVQNFTDIDDKMINRANKEGITVSELADRFIKEYYTDAEGLGVKKATVHPRATENIDAIIDLVKTLIEKGHAYEVGGDVYFSTKSFNGYGKLSHQPLEDLEAGARVEIGDKKKDPMDFALWKAQKPGEPAWESPWGLGRPGWHIECSAMATRYLGKTIDIHGGGQDLIFPHHENEIAQSEAANEQTFANYWIHNGYINIDNVKMSKSKGNFFTVRDIVKEFDYEVIRFFMLSAHYRSPINFSKDLLEQAKSALERLYNCRDNLLYLIDNATATKSASDIKKEIDEKVDAFNTAMDDDINTAGAIGVLFDMVKIINIKTASPLSKDELVYAYDTLCKLADVLGLLSKQKQTSLDEEVEELIRQRTQARKEKNFALADEIRDKLTQMDIVLEDTREGVKWHKKQ